MSDNLIREGKESAVSFKPGAYNRAERLKKLGFDLPVAPGKAIDELIDRAEQLQQAQDEIGQEIRDEQKELDRMKEALGL